MAMHANTPDDCLLVRHWVLLGEKSIPKESRWALGTHGLPQEGLNGCGTWVGGGGGSDRNICSALLVQYRGDAAVDAGMPRAQGGQSLVGGQQLPRLHTAASSPATPGKFVSTTRAPFLCQNWQRRLAVCE